MPEVPEQFDTETLARVGRLMLRARRIVEGIRAGIHRSPLHGASVEFAEHKEYTTGDDFRHIDWKLFGKSDKYYVKRFEEETNLLAHLVLDTSASMGYGRIGSRPRFFWQRAPLLRTRGEPQTGRQNGDGRARGVEDPDDERYRTKHGYATLLAAALAYLLIGQGDSVGLYTFGDGAAPYIPPRARSGHLSTLMAALSGIQPQGKGDIVASLADFAPRVIRRSLIILISDLLEEPEGILQALKTLRTRRNDVVVFHVLHTDELGFPFDDVSRFEDPEDRTQQLVVDPREIREGYQSELHNYLEMVRGSCFESHIDYQLMDTARPVSTALADFLASRMVVGRRG